MTRSELLAIDFTGQTVVIIGNPASGKTTLGNQLAARTGMPCFHADDYLPHGGVEALYVMLPDLLEMEKPLIVEGMAGYRLLRKGMQLDCFYPDVVIELHTTPEQVERVYRLERPGKSVKNLAGFMKGQTTILNEYKAMFNPHPPTWYVVQNEF